MTRYPPWLNEAPLQQLFTAVHNAGGEVRVVGGAVRDFLLERPVGDLDFACTLLPDRLIELAATQGWKAIPTGIAHGTVTLLLPGRMVEVTTLRRDVATDGRHATVAYTDNWQEDAARRDFTINAMYMDAIGTLYDYFGGKRDLKAARLRFIGDAAQRITEDGLRMLRYFRFLALLGWRADVEALAAITQKKALVANLSGERIQQEMHRLLEAPQPLDALKQMAECGIAPLVSNAEWGFARLQKILDLEAQHRLPPMPLARLLSLVDPAARPGMAEWIAKRWKLSRDHQKALSYVATPVEDRPTAPMVKEWLRHDARPLVTGRVLIAATDGADAAALIGLTQSWQPPKFPIAARDLLDRGMIEGTAIGDTLRTLEKKWAESDYTLSKEALLTMHAPAPGK